MRKENHLVAFYKNRFVDWKTFESHVSATRECILKNSNASDTNTVLNLCKDRYHFLVAFTATMLEGKVTILPANQSDGEVSRLTSEEEGLYLVDELEIGGICLLEAIDTGSDVHLDVDSLSRSMIVAKLYTSGSSGNPTAHSKTWGQLIDGANQVAGRFNFNSETQTNIIATVPPQHMFGFEMSIILPLVCNVCVHQKQPFYPLDIQQASNDINQVSKLSAYQVLVTTPVHLKACVSLLDGWRSVGNVISATSPLSEKLAQDVESIMGATAQEIYGCSEAGAIASRSVTRDATWKLLDSYSLNLVNNQSMLSVPAVTMPVLLPDNLKMLSERTFRLVGRISDMVKIGGKRGSLADLTNHLKLLKGVKDAIVFSHAVTDGRRERLAALVVSERENLDSLRKELSSKIDLVFLPRPICFVKELPYTPSGKLPKSALLECLKNNQKETCGC